MPNVVKYLLQHYVAKGLITVAQINSRIMEFEYGYSQVKDKPEPINPESLKDKPGKHICKDAAKMWMLFQILPFILKDIIDDSDKPSQVFKLLLKMSSLLLVPVISYENISLLQRLTKQFLMDFQDVFKRQLTRKMHYLIHCPRLVLLCGPLVRLWNMRLEGKHKDFKKTAKNASFKNIIFSLAKSEQRSMMAKLANPAGHAVFSDMDLQKGPSTFLRGKNLASTKKHFCRISDLLEESIIDVCDCKWVIFHGTKYISNECSLILWAENERPVFGDLLGI